MSQIKDSKKFRIRILVLLCLTLTTTPDTSTSFYSNFHLSFKTVNQPINKITRILSLCFELSLLRWSSLPCWRIMSVLYFWMKGVAKGPGGHEAYRVTAGRCTLCATEPVSDFAASITQFPLGCHVRPQLCQIYCTCVLKSFYAKASPFLSDLTPLPRRLTFKPHYSTYLTAFGGRVHSLPFPQFQWMSDRRR